MGIIKKIAYLFCLSISVIFTTIGTFLWIFGIIGEWLGRDNLLPVWVWIVWGVAIIASFYFRIKYSDLLDQIKHDASVGGSYAFTVPKGKDNETPTTKYSREEL